MRVFISIDLEGVAGVSTLDQIVRGGSGYPAACRLMTAEGNAAIAAAFDAGATEVVIADSHGTMDNLITAELDPRARCVSGAARPLSMVQGLAAGDAVAVFIGYHGAAEGVLGHVFSSNYTEVRVNGASMTELEVNALRAAALGVPVGAVSGDAHTCALARAAIPGVRTAEVKTGLGWGSAESLHPSPACELIGTAVRDAVAGAASLTVPAVPEEFRVAIDFSLVLAADLASYLPFSVRTAARTVEMTVPDTGALIGFLLASYHLSAVAATQFGAISARR